MKIQMPALTTTKLCHAKPGTVVQLTPNGGLDPEVYLVCVTPDARKTVRTAANNGLWSDERALHLTNLRTGETLTMPHLSSRAIIHGDAILVLGEGE